MEKHQGKFLLGAGIASILIGIIGKALNVAPMFQAMFKLMQLAVNMILMPIGTFIGAMIKPFLLMVITTLAPLFQEAMKKAMAVGTAVGQFLMNQGSFAAIINALMLDTSGNGENNTIQEPTTSSEKTIDQVVGVGATAAVVASSFYAVKKLIPVIGNKIGNFGANFFGRNNAVNTNTGTLKVGGSTPIYNNQGQVVPKNTPYTPKTNAIKNMGKVALPLLAFDLLFGESLENYFRKGVRDLTGANDDHNLVYSQGKSLRGGGLSNPNFANPDETPTFEAMNAWTTKLGITNKKWGDDEEDRNRMQNYFDAKNDDGSSLIDPFNPISDVAELTKEGAGKMVKAMTHVQLLEEAAKHMAVSSVGMEGKMKDIMDYYIKMKKDGKTAQQAMTNTAENFVHADATITAKLASWVAAARAMTAGEGKSKQPLKEALAAQNQYAYAQGIGDADNFFGANNAIGSGSLFVESGSSAAQKLKTRMEAEAQRAKENYDKLAAGNTMLYDQIYPSGEREEDKDSQKNKYKDRLAEIEKTQGITRAQMEQQLIDSGVNPQKTNTNPSNTPLLSTGGIDWNSYLNTDTNYGGGQINEPVFGIGRSGRTYSFGEHGSETVTPNGGGGGGITINIAKIEKNADFEQLKPMIQRWILEANSRRGMI
jgi:hypothetical protein